MSTNPSRPTIARRLVEPTPDGRAHLTALAYLLALAGVPAAVLDDGELLVIDCGDPRPEAMARALAVVQHLETLAPGGIAAQLGLQADLERVADAHARAFAAGADVAGEAATDAIERARRGPLQ